EQLVAFDNLTAIEQGRRLAAAEKESPIKMALSRTAAVEALEKRHSDERKQKLDDLYERLQEQVAGAGGTVAAQVAAEMIYRFWWETLKSRQKIRFRYSNKDGEFRIDADLKNGAILDYRGHFNRIEENRNLPSVGGLLKADLNTREAVRESGYEFKFNDALLPIEKAVNATEAALLPILAAGQVIGGVIESIEGGVLLAAPEPTGATKVVGVLMIAHGIDNVTAGVVTLATGQACRTVTSKSISATAELFGADADTAVIVGEIGDVAVGIGLASFSSAIRPRVVAPGMATAAEATMDLGRAERTAIGSAAEQVGSPSSAPRFRGDPFAFGTGPRDARVTALLDEASRASAVRLADLVDEVRYVQGSSNFDVVNGQRILSIGSDAFGKTHAGQLIEGVHEIGHAQFFDKLVRAKGFAAAEQEYFSLQRSFGTPLYGREEAIVERLARWRVRRHLGELTPQQEAASTKYIRGWWSVWTGNP
ncbi:MAG: hypothetical protein JSS02_27715, partial [Planctomycetes bacterium]|nr:hypothetical protein [Planctomycetota bacterium]